VNIACTDYLQAALAQPLILELRHRAPGVRVALRSLDVLQLETQLARGEVDLALTTPGAAAPGLRARHLFDERYVLIGRQGHPQLRRNITVEKFAQLEHVVVSLHGGGFVTPVDHALAALGHKRRVVLSAASFLFIPQIVAQSDFAGAAAVGARSRRGAEDRRMPISRAGL
jgi:DNA-binding transcriptional LysR family regulator